MCEMLDGRRRGAIGAVASRKLWKEVASVVCWTLAVVSALLAGAVFASGSVLCQGEGAACTPQTWALVLGVILALAFGAAGAALHTPRSSKPQGRFPWDDAR
jgi:uncharacterized membrane protein